MSYPIARDSASTVELPPPSQSSYVRDTAVCLWDNLPAVLLGSALFALACIPAAVLFTFGAVRLALLITALLIAPAWAVLLAREADAARDIKADVGRVARAWLRLWQRSMRFGLLMVIPVLAATFTTPFLNLSGPPAVIWGLLGAEAVALLMLVVSSLYVFPLMVLHDAPLPDAMRAAIVLSSRHIGNTIGLVAMGMVFLLATVYISLGLVFMLPGIWGLFIVNNCRMVVAEDGPS
jgi:uncharacterized membrane protein YesL